MKATQIHGILICSAIIVIFGQCFAYGQYGDTALENQVDQLAKRGDYVAVLNLIETQKNLAETKLNVYYFLTIGDIADTLTGELDSRFYWLGRQLVWQVLLKPTPNEMNVAQVVRLCKETLLFEAAENMGPYEFNASPEMFASIRHDTFLMLAEYARQVHATIVLGYQDKSVSLAERDKQNRIDNQVQAHAREAARWLRENQENYLIVAYSHEPRNDGELKALLDILDIQGGARDRIIQRSADEKRYWPTAKSSPTTNGNSGK